MMTYWFCGSKEGRVIAFPGDGVKIYPNPTLKGSGGTVQDQKSCTLNTHIGCGSGVVTEDGMIRFLTPRECLRLMGQNDEDITKLMDAEPKKTIQYRLAGNSIVVDVLAAIFKGIYIDQSFEEPKPKQTSIDRW